MVPGHIETKCFWTMQQQGQEVFCDWSRCGMSAFVLTVIGPAVEFSHFQRGSFFNFVIFIVLVFFFLNKLIHDSHRILEKHWTWSSYLCPCLCATLWIHCKSFWMKIRRQGGRKIFLCSLSIEKHIFVCAHISMYMPCLLTHLMLKPSGIDQLTVLETVKN